MHLAIAILLTQLALGSAYLVQNNSSSQLIKRDHHLAKRGDGSFTGRATYYATGLGACGDTNVDSDFIVALNAPQYTANKWCGKKIKIKFGKKSTTAVIKDECPGCSYGSLDMSPALFSFFASLDVGVFYMSWSLDDGSDDSPPPKPTIPLTPTPSSSPPSPSPSPATPAPPPPTKPAPSQKNGDSSNPPSPPPAKPAPSQQNGDSSNPPSPPPAKPAPSQKNGDLSNPPSPYHPGLNNDQSSTTGSAKSSTGSTTSPPTSSITLVDSGDSLTVHQEVSTQSSQSESQYASGGNLDAINQLVISFGSLAASSASSALAMQA